MSKTIFITGSTDGIGKLAAIRFAQDGHEVLLHGRNSEKLSTVITEVKGQTGNENIRGYLADFSDLEAVKKMAHQISGEVDSLDVLINNAGIFKSAISHNSDGLDIRYVVNYLAPFVLTNELTSLLQKGTDPRIINLSSAAQDSISYEVFSGKKNCPDMEAYSQSKLAITMWSFDLAEKYPDIAVTALNPGSLLNTNMVREAFGRHWAPADKGANILYKLAVTEAYNGVTGKYYDNDKGSFGQAHPDAYNKAERQKLMEATTNMLAN